MTCPTRKITLGTSGLPNLMLDKVPVGERLCDRAPADYPNAGERNATGGISDKGNLNFGATYEFEPTALLTGAEKALLGRYIAAYKTTSSTIFWLQDENEYLDSTEASGRPRTLVPDSTVSLGGATLGYYVFNTYLKIETPQFITFQGGDLWLLKGLKFIEAV
jgi:hypothetical protein